MARAKRHYIRGLIWHTPVKQASHLTGQVTHRCHVREFLLKFSRDRHRYPQWLYQARKRYDLTILNYMVTSNHVHLLVVDDGQRTNDALFGVKKYDIGPQNAYFWDVNAD